MMQVISLIWGIISLTGMLIAFIPCLGSLNWILIPFSVIGVIFCSVAYFSGEIERTPSMLGLLFCSAGVAFGLMRLIIGCGVV
jgi:hypothetical protein